jgi:hypothetical protein
MSVFFTRRGKAAEHYDENTILLLHGEDIIDSSMYGNAITNNGVTALADKSKFGGKSLYFDGVSYLTVPLAVNGDFTADFWAYTASFATDCPTPFSMPIGSNRGVFVYLMSDTTYLCDMSPNLISSQCAQVAAGAWHHYAVVRNGTTMSLFIDGEKKTSIAGVTTINDTIVLGCLPSAASASYFNGYIDEFRVSDIARWTSNFTPPTEPYAGASSGGAGGDSGGDDPEETTITFTVAGTTFTADPGMTWAQFVNSGYNTGAFVLDSAVGAVRYNGYAVRGSDGLFVQLTAQIIANGTYTT